jgi:hypothetical protein
MQVKMISGLGALLVGNDNPPYFGWFLQVRLLWFLPGNIRNGAPFDHCFARSAHRRLKKPGFLKISKCLNRQMQGSTLFALGFVAGRLCS